MSFLKLQEIDFSYKVDKVLHDFNLELEEGEIHCLLGPSGCGKSTILHLIAGFLRPCSGRIALGNRVLSQRPLNLEQDIFLPPELRHLGVVFQEPCLFPHLTVEENIRFGVKQKNDIDPLNKFLELIGLSHKKGCYPEALSGGEQQRVAMARAMASQPQVLLMDEPFSALDTSLRLKIRRQVKQLLRSFHLTALIVTHSHEEAFEMGDRVTVLDHSLGYQTGRSQDIFFHPQSSALVEFLKSGILIEGRYLSASKMVKTAHGSCEILNPSDFCDGQRVSLFVPFHNLQLAEGEFLLGSAKVASFYFYGDKVIYAFEGDKGVKPYFFEVKGPANKQFDEGDRIQLYLKEKTRLKALSC